MNKKFHYIIALIGIDNFLSLAYVSIIDRFNFPLLDKSQSLREVKAELDKTSMN